MVNAGPAASSDHFQLSWRLQLADNDALATEKNEFAIVGVWKPFGRLKEMEASGSQSAVIAAETPGAGRSMLRKCIPASGWNWNPPGSVRVGPSSSPRKRRVMPCDGLVV